MKRKNRDSCWTDLCPDLLIKIFAGLEAIDQLAFRSVCKAWRSLAATIPKEHIKQLWLMYPHGSEWTYTFVDFYSRPIFSSERIQGLSAAPDAIAHHKNIKRPTYTRKLPNLRGCSFLTAKHGWLLVGWYAQMPNYVINTFFYDPFSHATINLPAFAKPVWLINADLVENRLEIKFDFTAPPTSPECMVVAVFYCQFMNMLVTTTCRRGQAAWATPKLTRDFNSVWLSASMMVFHEGSFYCVEDRRMNIVVGKVLAFHPETNEIKSMSGHRRQTERGKNETGFERVLCDLIEPAVANDLVKKLGGQMMLQKLRSRLLSNPAKPLRICNKRDSCVPLGEIEMGYPKTYQPFLHKEGGQLLLVWHTPQYEMVKNCVWISKRSHPMQRNFQWAS